MRTAWIVVTALFLSQPIGGLRAETLTVGPGDDLRAALNQLQQRPEPRVLQLEPGRYELSQTLVLSAADSGVMITSTKPLEAKLVGSIRLANWKLVDEARSIFETPVPKGLITRSPRHLMLNGKPLTRARTPNTGWWETPGKLSLTPPFEMAIPEGQFSKSWRVEDEIWVVCLQKWAGFKLPVQKIDLDKGTVTLSGKLHAHRQEKINRFWIENAPDALDAPGEWRFDPSRQVIQLIPPQGIDLAKAEVTLPHLEELLRLENCQKITIKGVAFQDCEDNLPLAGEIDTQAAAGRRGAVRLMAARDVLLQNCAVQNVGGYGIDVGRGSQNCQMVSCQLRSSGAGGIRIGETKPETAADALVSGHVVRDCEISDYGRTYLGAVGAIIFHASHNQLVNNEIHHGNYTAVSVGWTWGYRDSPCHHNLVEGNSLHHLGGDLLSDMGGVYLLGPQPGTVVRRNKIHTVDCHDYGGWGLYTDEGSSQIVLEENIVWNCAKAGFHQHYGRDNLVRNNLFVNCGEGGVRRSREEDHNSFTFEQNVVICENPQFDQANWKNGNAILRNNLYYSPADGPATWGGMSWAEWQKKGYDQGSQVANPLLRNPERPELGLADDSPAGALGIRIPNLGE